VWAGGIGSGRIGGGGDARSPHSPQCTHATVSFRHTHLGARAHCVTSTHRCARATLCKRRAKGLGRWPYRESKQACLAGVLVSPCYVGMDLALAGLALHKCGAAATAVHWRVAVTRQRVASTQHSKFDPAARGPGGLFHSTPGSLWDGLDRPRRWGLGMGRRLVSGRSVSLSGPLALSGGRSGTLLPLAVGWRFYAMSVRIMLSCVGCRVEIGAVALLCRQDRSQGGVGSSAGGGRQHRRCSVPFKRSEASVCAVAVVWRSLL